MNPWVRWVVIGAAAVGIVVLFVALQPGEADDDLSPTPSPTTSVSPTATPDGSPSPSPSPSPTPRARVIEVTVRGGEVRGPARPSVRQGGTVVLVVRADVSDHVHVHGYDLVGDVAPESPARLAFRATIPGRFEIELEDRGLPIAELTVRP